MEEKPRPRKPSEVMKRQALWLTARKVEFHSRDPLAVEKTSWKAQPATTSPSIYGMVENESRLTEVEESAPLYRVRLKPLPLGHKLSVQLTPVTHAVEEPVSNKNR